MMVPVQHFCLLSRGLTHHPFILCRKIDGNRDPFSEGVKTYHVNRTCNCTSYCTVPELSDEPECINQCTVVGTRHSAIGNKDLVIASGHPSKGSGDRSKYNNRPPRCSSSPPAKLPIGLIDISPTLTAPLELWVAVVGEK